LTDDNIAYEPGDAIGICCPNKSDAIEVVLDRLKKAEPEKNYSMNTLLNSNGNSATLTLGELLTYKIDLTTSLKKSDVMLLSKYCYDDTEKNQLQWLCSKGNKTIISHFICRT
jgi:sulfite reductase alpha subunit-like flavoprotein